MEKFTFDEIDRAAKSKKKKIYLVKKEVFLA